MIDTATQVCALIGDPVAHSMSPAIHNAAFKEKGLNYVYLASAVKDKDVKAAIRGMRAFGFRGLSVTIPHKVAVMPCVDWVDPIAEGIGAVNTIVRSPEGELTGYNTDGLGA